MNIPNAIPESTAAQRSNQPSHLPVGGTPGPSVAPSDHGRLPLVVPGDRVPAGRPLDIRRLPPRQAIDHAFTHAAEVETLKGRLEGPISDIQVVGLVREAPTEALQYLEWTGTLGPHEALVGRELASRAEAGAQLAGMTDEVLDVLITSGESSVKRLAKVEKERRTEVKRLYGISEAMLEQSQVQHDPQLAHLGGSELKALAHALPDDVPLTRRAAAFKEWSRRREDPDSVVRGCWGREPLDHKAAEYAFLHSNELKALIPALNALDGEAVVRELHQWPSEALDCLVRHCDTWPSVKEAIATNRSETSARASELAGMSLRELHPPIKLAAQELERRVSVAIVNVQAAEILRPFGSSPGAPPVGGQR